MADQDYTPEQLEALKAKALSQPLVTHIYTADPSIKKNDLVTLEDTKGLFLASAVVPVASDDVSDDAAAVIDEISAAMTPEDLIALNARSVEEKLSAEVIAKDWLEDKGLS